MNNLYLIIEGDVLGVMDRPTGDGDEWDSERQKWYSPRRMSYRRNGV